MPVGLGCIRTQVEMCTVCGLRKVYGDCFIKCDLVKLVRKQIVWLRVLNQARR